MPTRNAPLSVVRTLLDDLTREARHAHRGTPFAVLAQLIASLALAALVADDAGSFILTNPVAAELTGYSADELRRLSVWDLTPTVNEREAETLWRAFLQQREQSGDYHLLTKDRRTVIAAYAARAHVLPGMHVSLLQPF
jgi:PAS domain S-box-containing protein